MDWVEALSLVSVKLAYWRTFVSSIINYHPPRTRGAYLYRDGAYLGYNRIAPETWTTIHSMGPPISKSMEGTKRKSMIRVTSDDQLVRRHWQPAADYID